MNIIPIIFQLLLAFFFLLQFLFYSFSHPVSIYPKKKKKKKERKNNNRRRDRSFQTNRYCRIYFSFSLHFPSCFFNKESRDSLEKRKKREGRRQEEKKRKTRNSERNNH